MAKILRFRGEVYLLLIQKPKTDVHNGVIQGWRRIQTDTLHLPTHDQVYQSNKSQSTQVLSLPSVLQMMLVLEIRTALVILTKNIRAIFFF